MPHPDPYLVGKKTFSQRIRSIFRRRKQLRRAFFEDIRRRNLRYEPLEDRSLLATVTWDGGAGTFNFGDAANWDNDAVPTAVNDYVIPDLAGTPTINVATTASIRSLTSAERVSVATSGTTLTVSANTSFSAGLDLSNGTLSIGSGATTTLNGTTSWVGNGAITGAGTIRNEGLLTYATTIDRAIPSTFDNRGTFHFTGGFRLLINAGSTFENRPAAVFDLATTLLVGPLGRSGATGGNFNNAGTLIKTTSGSSSLTQIPIHSQNGTFEVTQGTFIVQPLGGLFDGAHFVAASGATLELRPNMTWRGTFTGSGAGLVTATNLSHTIHPDGATLNFPDGLMQWSGTSPGGGAITIPTGSFLSVGMNITTFNSVVDVYGTMRRIGTSNFFVQPSGRLNIMPGGLIVNQRSTAGSFITFNSSAGQFYNYGTIRNDAPGIHSIGLPFYNVGGTIEVQQGSLTQNNVFSGSFPDAYVDGANFIVAAGSTLSFNAERNWKGTISGSGAGTLTLGPASIDPSGATFDFLDGFASITQGSISGPGVLTIPSGRVLTNNSSGTTTISSTVDVFGRLRTMTNVTVGGAVNVHSGGILQVQLQTLSVQSSLNIFAGGQLDLAGGNVGGTGTLTNSGLIRRSAGTGSTGASLRIDNDGGTIEVTGGTSAYTVNAITNFNGGHLVAAAGAALVLSGNARNWKGTITAAGAGSISMAGTASIDSAGAVFDFPTGLVSWPSGILNGPGELTIPSNSELTLTTTGTKSLNTTIAVDGLLKIAGTTTVNSSGTIDVRSIGTLLITTGDFSNATGLIVNRGTIRKDEAGGSVIASPINNLGGTVRVDVGTLEIQRAGTWDSATFLTATNALLDFPGEQNWKGTITATGTGTVELAGGSIDSSGAIFDFPSSLVNWTTGTFAGPGNLTIPASSVLNTSVSTKTLSTTLVVQGRLNLGALTVAGILDIASGGVVQVGGQLTVNSTIEVSAGGTLHLTTGDISTNNGTINNLGTIRKSDVGTSGIAAVINNLGGTLLVEFGTLQINGTGTFFDGGLFNVSSGASLSIFGNNTWKGTIVGTGLGTVIKGGQFNIHDSGVTLDFPENMFSFGTGTVGDGGAGVLSIAPGAFVQMTGTNHTLLSRMEVHGTLKNYSPFVNYPGLIHIKPEGLYDLSGGSVASSGTGGEGSMLNEGTIRVDTESASITNPLDSPGVIEILNAGLLQISSPIAQHPGTTLNGGTWIVNGTLTFPSGGGAVTSLGPNATVVLDGSASFLRMEANQLLSNEGSLTIRGGKSFATYRQFTNNGTLNIEAGSSLTVPNTAPTPNYTQTGGQTIVRGSLTAPAVNITGGVLAGTGTISSTVTNSAGIVAPGLSPGKLTINGNYVQEFAGSLNMEVGGTNDLTPEFDRLVVTGSASLAGALNVSVIDEFLPSKGETFRFMTFASRTGDFATKNLADYLEYPLFGTDLGSNYYDLTSRNIVVRTNADSGPYSIRQAILDANASSDADVIVLNIPGNGPHTISPVSQLPTITQPVIIDAYTQRGAKRNTLQLGSDATLMVELNGASALGATGLLVHSNDVTLTGLSITGWMDEGIVVEAGVSGGVNIAGNYVGLRPDGITSRPNSSGVFLHGGASNVLIGGTTPASRNVISGNVFIGVLIEDAGTTNNTIANNYVGTDASGNLSIENSIGIMVGQAAAGNTIGGVTPQSRNVISGNDARNILVLDAGTNNTTIIGNYIGTDPTGSTAVFPTTNIGIAIDGNITGTRIGLPTSIPGTGGGNVIAGHLENIYLNATNTLIQGNLIGTDSTGTQAVGGNTGVRVVWGPNLIGGSAFNERNVISGNDGPGIAISGLVAQNNTIAGNVIGTSIDGTTALPNVGSGVLVESGATFNSIGGVTTGTRNIISGNMGAGVHVQGATTTDNSIAGNFIGLNSVGNASIANQLAGIFVDNASFTIIGGSTSASQNVISGNSVAGVRIAGANASDNSILWNRIGTDPSGEIAIPNDVGVLLDTGAHNNLIGQGIAIPNLISGNTDAGIKIIGAGTRANISTGNVIGLNTIGNALGNGVGVLVLGADDDNDLGGLSSEDRNVISGNIGAGVFFQGTNNGQSLVANNWIGLDPSGVLDRGNLGSGIVVESDDIQILNNTISGNALDGVDLTGSTAFLSNNRIGLDPFGTLVIGNDRHGVWIGGTGLSTVITNNIISGNSAGIRTDGTSSQIKSNRIGTNASGLRMLGNRRGSGTSTNGHFGILSTGPNVQIGDVAEANVIVGHDIGLSFESPNASGTVRNNLLGTDSLEVASMPNSVGIQLANGVANITLADNTIANSLVAGLRLLDDTSNHNTFSGNRYFGNLGSAIDIGLAGSTLNDAGDIDGWLNFPVITYANIEGTDLVLRGFVGAGRTIEFYVSTPTINGIGQGATSIATLTEGTPSDGDGSNGSYGPVERGVVVGAASGERFRFALPLSSLPPELRYGSLITAVALGSTSEFGNAVTIGDPTSALTPIITLPVGLTLAQGEALRVVGSFRDDDSTDWTLTVDYGDGSGIQPLTFAADRTFVLEHEYSTASPNAVPYQVTVRAIDNSNRMGVGVMAVSVSNEPPQPTFNSFHFEPVVEEGSVFTFAGAFSDTGVTDSHIVTIDWGDNTPFTTVAIPVGARSFNATHVYVDDGLSNNDREFYRILVTIQDNHGGIANTPDGLYIVEVANAMPTNLSIATPSTVVENQTFALNGLFSDIGLDDEHVVTIDWGDGSPKEVVSTSTLVSDPSFHAFDILHRYADNPVFPTSAFTVTVTVSDDDDPLHSIIATKAIIVTNELPVVSVTPSVTVLEEGGSLSLAIQVDDSGTQDNHQVFIHWGDGSEVTVVDLAPGVTSIPIQTHRYANDPALGNQYTLEVRVRDQDMPPATFVVDSRPITVNNVAPTVTSWLLEKRTSAGWTNVGNGDSIVEGDEIRISGTYSDPGLRDLHTVQVQWAAGVTTNASVSRSNRTFQATYKYGDDFPLGTSFDDISIEVQLSDSDGGMALVSQDIRVSNVAPVASFVPEVIATAGLIPLRAIANDPGSELLQYDWSATDGVTTVTGTGPFFNVPLGTLVASTILVTVVVRDDDGGIGTYSAALKLGSSNPDVLSITTADFPLNPDLTYKTNTLLVLGLEGDDVLDASSLPATLRVILDGGDGTDLLYGGAGDDIFILRSGNDSANVSAAYPPPIPGVVLPAIVPNYVGRDRYYLKPNSTLTVVDLDGTLENSLDFSIASMAIAFNLDTTRGALLVPQEVSVGGHYVAALGGFNELTGSQWNDLLTGASQSTVYGGQGADQLKAISGTTDARFSGGQDADVFETSGAGLTSISFEGDDGADTFTNLGQLGFDIEFRGGADADVFTNTLTGILESLSFEGDDGADVFINAGLFDAIVGSSIVFQGGSDADVFTNLATGILETLSFEGDDGADVFTNAGDLLTQVYFLGGADADVFTNAGTGLVESLSFEGDDGADVFMNQLSGILINVSFEGDDGADVFTNLGVMDAIAGGSIEFLGGADADVFANGTTGILEMLSFEGDDGADVFTNAGLLDASVVGSIVFTGGADADVFVNSATGIIELLSFEGDDGADTFTNIGLLDAIVGGGISFQGGADADVFTNIANGIIESLSFEGDDGADVFTNAGLLDAVTGGSIFFMGGADADVFTNTLSGLLESLSFEGDDGADVFTNFGLLDAVSGGSIVFTGGADADVFSNASSGILESLSFEGDDGADVFVNAGLFDAVGITIIEFMGGADADVFTNLATGIVETLSFEGDDGADVFVNYGNLLGVLGDVVFTGGADADVFVNTISGLATNISFEGDDGADVFENLGDVLATGQIVFTGGADGDRLYNADSGMNSIRFIGYLGSTSSPTTNDDSADVFVNLGDLIGLISFEGDDGADVFSNAGDSISTISFEGDDGADVFVSLGDLVGAISFEGDGGDDVLGVYGTNIGAILFAGDPTDIGNDTFVNRSIASPTGPGTLAYYGFGGNDALRNDGRGWKVQFFGYADDDAFQNNADLLTELEFRGDIGRDVFENNGNSLFDILFEGDDGADVFANGGDFVSLIHFVGGADGDVFVNSGDWLSQLRYEGDDGADVFANLGADLTSISFEGDAGNDRVFNDGRRMSLFTFVGGAGGDTFVNRELAVGARNLTFSAGLGDDGPDVFINQASALDGFVFSGGADADVFQNSGMDVVNVSFEGDDGADSVLNTGFGLGEFRFIGGSDADVFENRGDGLFSIAFEGGAGPDSFVQRGNRSVDFFFTGGQDADVFTNFGSYLTSLRFEGDDGENRFQNNGSDIETIEFVGGVDADSFQNNNDRIETIGFQGGGGSDTLLNNGSDVGSILFVGDDGADALVHVGDNIVSIEFLAGTDSDIMRLSGAQLQSVNFDGNEGTDSLLLDASVTQLTFTGGTENDIAILRGSLQSASVSLGEGDDRFTILGQSVAVTLNGGLGDDTFEFAGTPSGLYNLVEMYYGAADTSNDTIDLSSMTGDANLDLSLTTVQTQSNGVAIQLSDGMGIERVMGTTGADNLRGNPRDNYIGGAQFYYADADRTPLVAPRPTQWVVLDFSDTEPLRGEYVYTETDKQTIVLRLEQAYAAFNQSHAAIRFTWNIEEVPTGIEHVTLYFNRTPDSGRPGGDASEVDLGNQAYGGFANIQANGLLGGIEIPTTDNEDFMESLPEDSESRLGQDKPSATVANMIEISAKIAAHELAHLLGLRHYDSFGPIGFGVHSPPGNSDFKPIFVGPSAAFETFDHLIGSPASVGSTRNNDVRGLFFGEREAIKIAYSLLDPLSTTVEEFSADVNSPQALDWVPISVPNSLTSGLNQPKDFVVDIASVRGSIELDGNAVSQSDFYRFSGQRGDLLTIEVLSKSLRRYLNGGVDGYIDSMIRVRDANGELVPYHTGFAMNDDEFESSDSLLLDLQLPDNGEYVLEVDTFSRPSTDPFYLDAIQSRDELLALTAPSAEQRELLEILNDSLLDQDVGNYEVFMYRFQKASSIDLIDRLAGGGGQDMIDGGPGDFGIIDFVPFPPSLTLPEANQFQFTIDFLDERALSFTAEVDYGDGSGLQPTTVVLTPQPHILLDHDYQDNGNYQLSFSIRSNWGALGTGNIALNVTNRSPELGALAVVGAPFQEGSTITISTSGIDPAGALDPLEYTFQVWKDTDANPIFVATHSNPTTTFTPNDNGTYRIEVTVHDGDGGFDQSTTTVTVDNLTPTATINSPDPIDEGASAAITLVGADVSSVDAATLKYSFALTELSLAGDYSAASSTNSAVFAFIDNGLYTVYGRVYDKDGGTNTYTTIVGVNNVIPTATINSPDPIDEGASATITLVGADVSSVDAATLKYSFALTESSLAGEYSAASSTNTAVFAFIDNGLYTVYGRVYDKDGGTNTYTTIVTVNNMSPTATINSLDPIDEGLSAAITLVGEDASSVDSATLKYSFSLTESSLAGDYSAASSTNSAVFAFIDNGLYTVYGRVYDKDGGISTYTTIVTVNNITPTATISLPEPIDEGLSAAITLVGEDASSVDSTTLKYSLSLTESSLAGDYSAASSTKSAVFAFADNGIYTVYGRVYDKDGGVSTYTTTVTVNNVAPTATLQLSNSIINVGQSVNVQLMLPIDPSTFDVSAGLRYSFAQSTISLANTYASASTSAMAIFPFSTSGVYSLYARIFDQDNAFSEYSAQVTVIGVSSNTPPTLSIIGPVDSVQNVSSGFTLNASDADPGDALGPFTYVIQWGDGTSNTVTGGSTVVVNKIFANVSSEQGVFRITATVTDARGATSSTATRNQAVMGWTVSVDPLNTSRRILTIVGSQSDDSIKLRDSNRHDDVIRVKVKNKEDDVKIKGFASSDVDRILIFGLGGDDHIDVDQDIDIQAQIWGGHGNDKINGGGGSDVLLGEVGDDKLDGGDGRDLLIGGMGRDDLRGDRGDDILIAGYTVYDQNRAALDLIMAEWTRTDCDSTYERRRKNLTGTSHPTFGARRNENIFLRFGTNNSIPATVDTVFDDNVEDVLRGDQGNDWFLLELTGPNEQRDKLKDLAHGERADDL